MPNRRHILGLLDEALAANEYMGTGLCIAVIDIDHFKAINDAHGHEAGGAVLEHSAWSCRERVRTQDHLGRIGGEEFLLLPAVSLDTPRASSIASGTASLRRWCCTAGSNCLAPSALE
jgi:diguanylate cyclase (GGDEF)-like protein